MRKITIVDLAAAFALLLVSALFFVWVLKITTVKVDWNWSAIETIGTWFSGIFTAAAVVVSLFLAGRTDRKERANDYLRARMTALRYLPPLMKLQISLHSLGIWAKGKRMWPIDANGDSKVIQTVMSLFLDVPIDDLVLLAPIEKHFAERLHALSMQLETCRGTIEPLRTSLTLTYTSPLNQNAADEAEAQLKVATKQVALHVTGALDLLNPLLATCANYAYALKKPPADV